MEFLKKYAWIYLLVLAASIVLPVAASETVTLVSGILDEPDPVPLTLVIDPGHGGEDGGAVSCTGELESRINLSISLRLNDLLRLLGYRTKMTRSEDISIYGKDAVTVSEKKVSDLKNRVRIVNGTDHAILLSIHQNLFEEAQYHGAQVFYAPTSGSIQFAEAVQMALRTGLEPSNHRQTKQAQNVYLMNKIRCPGILVECGFLSNPTEEALLRSEDYQKKLTCAIVSGLNTYLVEADGAS